MPKIQPPYQRKQALHLAGSEVFDLLIIGGGITAAGIARDAAMRGLKTLLVERGDFASGTSSKSSKLVHGGLRYLAHCHFKLVWESCRERYYLMKTVAPHIVKPLPFILPFYKKSSHPRWLLVLGLFVYEILSLFRNYRGFRTLSKQKLFNLVPGINVSECKGAATYYDCKVLDFRLTIDTLKSAREAGATLLNYCKVNSIELQSGVVRLEDTLNHRSFEARTKVIVNAAGAWADDILKMVNSSDLFHLKCTSGIHLVLSTPNVTLSRAIAFESPIDRRNIFIIPWGHFLLLGTTDDYVEGRIDNISIKEKAVEYLLTSINDLFPNAGLDHSNIHSTYLGVRPLIGSDKNKKESDLPRDFMIKIHKEGMISITGGKLTTYRSMSKILVDKVIKQFFKGRKLKPCQTRSPLLGTNGADISNQNLQDRLDYLVDHEFVQRLSDFFLRRTDLFLFGANNGLEILQPVAKHLGQRLGWSEQMVEKEISQYKSLVRSIKTKDSL